MIISDIIPNTRPVIVSPSMSGQYSVDLLFARPDRFCGFVPVAPTAVSKHSEDKYESVGVPTLIVRGENDKSLGVTADKFLTHIPTASQVQVNAAAPFPYKLLYRISGFLQNLAKL